MRVTKAEHAGVARGAAQFPAGRLPEVALAGRSNAGKSSVINCLLNRKKLARSGQTPGVTQEVHFYKINDAFHFVDLPGYGYARVSKAERERWRRVIEQYLTEREPLRLVLVILDCRREPDDLDRMLLDWLRHQGLPFVIVANKADKLGNAERERARRALAEGLQLESTDPVLLFSAQSGMNTQRLWTLIQGHL
ncbi:MAG: YihA family ribosome biogenesis GTP-binding protein [Candidatus Sericytochromatia bacterium]|nr:YihA family ribosome biogenesis GTP-binding protein [Candidatus Tanganyikabacteria bacterium]